MYFLKDKDKRRGFIGTVLIHLLLLLAFIFFGLTTPLPLPEEEGIVINFGTSEEGFGEVQPEEVTSSEETPESMENQINETATEEVSQSKEEVVTQQIEEAPFVADENQYL